mgnify:CR=1 FL=1
MNSIMQSEIFFFISSIGFVILWVLIAILVIYLIRATKTFNKIIEKVEKDIDHIGDTTKEMLEEVKDSYIFNLVFGKKKKRKKD